jgi:hypothetical protein
MGGKLRRFIAEKVLPLPPAQVWELSSHTEHLPQTIGLPSVVYEAPVVTNDNFYRYASIKLLCLIPCLGADVGKVPVCAMHEET